MMLYTSAQADQIRGYWVPGHALAPRPINIAATALLAGKFALPDAVLTDPAYTAIPALLALLQAGLHVLDSSIRVGTYDMTTNTWTSPTDWDTNQTVTVNNSYKNAWPLGAPVAVGPSAI